MVMQIKKLSDCFWEKISAGILIFCFIMQWFCAGALAESNISKIWEENYRARGLSLDGTTVIGYFGVKSFSWKNGVVTWLPGGFAEARGINADGTVVVGDALYAFRWTAATGMQDLGDLGGGAATAESVSADGSVVVGKSENAGGELLAFRWTQAGGMVSLGSLNAVDVESVANDVNATGDIVVGYSRDADVGVNDKAFRWTQAGGMVSLGVLTLTPGEESYANAISSDGTVIVGSSGNSAFRWQGGVMSNLGSLGGTTDALDVNSDGSVVVGESQNGAGNNEAFRWTQATGIKSLKTVLQTKGVDLTGWNLTSATAVSGDGESFVGNSTNAGGKNEIFLARLNINGTSGMITGFGLNESLSEQAPTPSLVASMGLAFSSFVNNASHNALTSITDQPERVLVASNGSLSGIGLLPSRKHAQTYFWTVGALISDHQFSGAESGGEGGLGFTRHQDNGMGFGGGLFYGKRSRDTTHNGNQKIELIGPGLFAVYAPKNTGLGFEVGAHWDHLDLNQVRGYENGAGSASSHGETHGQVFNLSSRIGWTFPIVKSFNLQPFARYDWQRTHIQGYTESGGTFPAEFDSRTEYLNQVRIGLEAQYAFSPVLDFTTWASVFHRFEDQGSSMGGNVSGFGEFNYSGTIIDKNWGDVGLKVKWKPWKGFEIFSSASCGIESSYNAYPELALIFGMGWAL